MLQLNKDQTDCSQPPSLDPSTAPFQMIWWRKSGRKQQVNNVSNDLLLTRQTHGIQSDMIYQTRHPDVWKITISEHPIPKNQPLRFLWLTLLPKVFQHTFHETSIFWKCNKREGNAIFWVGKKGLDYRCFKCCCKKPDVFFVQPPPSSSDPACWVTWDLSARYSLQRRGQLDSSCGIFCLDTSTMDLNLPARYPRWIVYTLYFQYNKWVYPHFRQEIHLPPANSKSFRRSTNPGRSRFQIDFVVFSSSFREKKRCDSRHMNHNMILETASLSVSTTLNQPIEFQYLMIDYD